MVKLFPKKAKMKALIDYVHKSHSAFCKNAIQNFSISVFVALDRLSIVPFSMLLRGFVVGQWFDISLYSCDPLQDMLLPHHHKVTDY